MNSKWWYPGFKGFFETANLVSLSILAVAAYLTVDWMLFGLGIAVEAVYLGWTFRSLSYRSKLELRAQAGKPDVDPLDPTLLVVTVTGFVAILFFGFGKHLLNHRFPDLTHAEGWEAGAIVWTGLFLLYYLIKFRATGNVFVDKFVIVLIAFLGAVLLILAWNSMGRWEHHIPFVMAVGLCFLVIDLLSALLHTDKKERMLSRNSLWWADVPMVFAFAILWSYLLIHRDTENPDVFVSGVISCQLLISNVAFVVMEFGLLQPPQVASSTSEEANSFPQEISPSSTGSTIAARDAADRGSLGERHHGSAGGSAAFPGVRSGADGSGAGAVPYPGDRTVAEPPASSRLERA